MENWGGNWRSREESLNDQSSERVGRKGVSARLRLFQPAVLLRRQVHVEAASASCDSVLNSRTALKVQISFPAFGQLDDFFFACERHCLSQRRLQIAFKELDVPSLTALEAGIHARHGGEYSGGGESGLWIATRCELWKVSRLSGFALSCVVLESLREAGLQVVPCATLLCLFHNRYKTIPGQWQLFRMHLSASARNLLP